MILRLQSLFAGLLAVLTAALLALVPASANPASGGYQLFEPVALEHQQHIQLASLGNFDYHAKIASECCNATNRGQDLIEASGRLGGEIYSASKLRQLESYLSRRGITLKVGDEHLPPNGAGAFNYAKGELLLRSNPTSYEVWHELSHYLHYRKIGAEAYSNLPRSTLNNVPEQFVFDMLENSKRRWGNLNDVERRHAIDYIERIGGFR